jgi:hypothetical protein
MTSSRQRAACGCCLRFALAFACLALGQHAHAQDPPPPAVPPATNGATRESQLLAPDAFPDPPSSAPASAVEPDAAEPEPSATKLPPRLRAFLPSALGVRVERCATPTFEVDTLAHVLDIELVALGIGEPASDAVQPALLTLSLPACGDELRIELQGRGQIAVDSVRVSELESVGRERALALATIERLAPLWSQIVEAASRPQLRPVLEPPAPEPDQPNRELHAAFGVGFAGAPSYEVRLTLDYELAPALYLDASLLYATEAGRRILAQVVSASGSSALTATVQAHAIVGHLALEGRIGDGKPIHMFVASGLTAGAAIADGQLEGTLPAHEGHLAPSSTGAPLLLTGLALGVRAPLGANLIASARFDARYIIIGPTFWALDVKVIEWTGLGFGAGIGIGYVF